MQMTPLPLLLMMVSMARAVLPVWRSPITSSRWPRPMLTMLSMALMPVSSGSRTGWRSTTPAVEAGDAVSHRQHRPHLGHVHPGREAPQLLADDPADLVGADVHGRLAPGLPFQDRAEGAQPAPDRAVVGVAAHLQEHAPEDR